MKAKAAGTVLGPADPCCFVTFGASGDLTRRLLIPALYNLAADALLPDAFCIVGVGRTKFTTDAFREHLRKGLREFAKRELDDAVTHKLLACITYLEGDVESPDTYE